MIPERLFRILKECENPDTSHFPATAIFNEGWMLRLILDAVERLNVQGQPLSFLNGSRWFSEARLISPFRPRFKKDPLGEGSTNADAVIGHFAIASPTRAGIELRPDVRQFVVAEAKMFSNLSSGTKYVDGYNQAARNVACMAYAIERSRVPLEKIESVGFVLVVPKRDKGCSWGTNWETCMTRDSISTAVDRRIAAYEAKRPEVAALRQWQSNYFLPLVECLEKNQSLKVLTWEELIGAVQAADQSCGDELSVFYDQCLRFAPNM